MEGLRRSTLRQQSWTADPDPTVTTQFAGTNLAGPRRTQDTASSVQVQLEPSAEDLAAGAVVRLGTSKDQWELGLLLRDMLTRAMLPQSHCTMVVFIGELLISIVEL